MPKKSMQQNKRQRSFSIISLFVFLVIVALSFVVTNKILSVIEKPPLCANSKSCKSDLTLDIENGAKGSFAGKTVIPPTIDATELVSPAVMGTKTAKGNKHIYVDLKHQTLYAYEGADLYLQTLVSTGKWGKTPIGNFNIWEKLVATRMSGGEGDDAYDLPNVPYVMYFFHDFGLHGAYWHDNFGHTMSHGCVNMRQIDAKKLYDWADGPDNNNLGTPVSICNEILNGNKCVQTDPIQ